eukprot:468455_1
MQTSPEDVRHHKKQKTDNGVNPTHTHSNTHQHLRSTTEIPPPIQINNHNNNNNASISAIKTKNRKKKSIQQKYMDLRNRVDSQLRFEKLSDMIIIEPNLSWWYYQLCRKKGRQPCGVNVWNDCEHDIKH